MCVHKCTEQGTDVISVSLRSVSLTVLGKTRMEKRPKTSVLHRKKSEVILGGPRKKLVAIHMEMMVLWRAGVG